MELKKYNLVKERYLTNRSILCKDNNGNRFVFKKARGDECIMASLINELAKDYNSRFSVLQLPTYTRIDKSNNIVIMPFYGDKNYINSWNSGGLYGGKDIKLKLAKEMVQIILDFSKVNINKIIKHLEKHKIKNFQFNFEDWRNQFINGARIFLQRGQISQEEFDKAKKLLKKGFKRSKLIFNNGDYYPRNLVSFKNKIVVVDWETWNNNYRANIIDYIENVAAFTFIHMWENKQWQIEFLKELRKCFRINFKNLRRAVLIKSFEQALFWKTNKTKCEKELGIFRNFLDDSYIGHLKKYTKPSILDVLNRFFNKL